MLVLWGHAYAAYSMQDRGVITRDGMFEGGTATWAYGTRAAQPLANLPKLKWLEHEGHLPRVWQLVKTTVDTIYTCTATDHSLTR